jgi:UDP-N-acetylglucosamine diphosphorylase/glucosamine-1-phosphate N-acetyltransferase
MRLCAYEDAGVSNLEPLTLTRPAFDLRCGATSLFERQRRFFAATSCAAVVRPDLALLLPLTYPDLPVNDSGWLQDGPLVLVNARWLPPVGQAPSGATPCVGLVGEEIAYAVLPTADTRNLSANNLAWRLADYRQKLPAGPAGGCLIDHPWDLLEQNGAALEQDYEDWHTAGMPRPQGVSVVGPAERFRAAPTASIEPMVLIDTTRGPVLVDDGAVVQAFSRLEGPCYVGPDSQLFAARIKGSSIGPQCRIGGEVEGSIVHGFSNKAHEGFLGHSYVGEWVNLGAGTQTSDLRTDYGTVHMNMGGRTVDTGLLKVGSFIGDHTKTSMNVLFNTGSRVGAFAQLLTSGTLLPRLVPSFCQFGHGRVQERSDLREMFTTAATAMARRGRHWTEAHAEFFLALFEQTAAERRQLIRESEQRRFRRVI